MARLSDEQARALNELLRSDLAARDEYILRLELHSRLASEPDLFVAVNEANEASSPGRGTTLPQNVRHASISPATCGFDKLNWALALAACVALLATGWWGLQAWRQGERKGATSKAVAMLNRVVDAAVERRPGERRAWERRWSQAGYGSNRVWRKLFFTAERGS